MSWKLPEQYRTDQTNFGKTGEAHGKFVCPSPDKSRITKTELFIIASNGRGLNDQILMTFNLTDADRGWEHVSVHARKRIDKNIRRMIPTWEEMCFVKSLFWDAEDIVFQLHPAKSAYINQTPFVLHLWRHPEKPVPLPPTIFVGIDPARV